MLHGCIVIMRLRGMCMCRPWQKFSSMALQTWQWAHTVLGTILGVYTGLLHLYVEIENKVLNGVPLLLKYHCTQLIFQYPSSGLPPYSLFTIKLTYRVRREVKKKKLIM